MSVAPRTLGTAAGEDLAASIKGRAATGAEDLGASVKGSGASAAEELATATKESSAIGAEDLGAAIKESMGTGAEDLGAAVKEASLTGAEDIGGSIKTAGEAAAEDMGAAIKTAGGSIGVGKKKTPSGGGEPTGEDPAKEVEPAATALPLGTAGFVLAGGTLLGGDNGPMQAQQNAAADLPYFAKQYGINGPPKPSDAGKLEKMLSDAQGNKGVFKGGGAETAALAADIKATIAHLSTSFQSVTAVVAKDSTISSKFSTLDSAIAKQQAAIDKLGPHLAMLATEPSAKATETEITRLQQLLATEKTLGMSKTSQDQTKTEIKALQKHVDDVKTTASTLSHEKTNLAGLEKVRSQLVKVTTETHTTGSTIKGGVEIKKLPAQKSILSGVLQVKWK